MIFAYFKSLWYWYQAGDLILTFPLGHSFLNEIPMSEFLDTYTQGEDPAIVSYHFTATRMARVMGDSFVTEIRDVSGFDSYPVALMGADDNYLASSYPEYYRPSEVDGETATPATKLDAHAALHEYRPDSTEPVLIDPNEILV